MSPPKRPAEGSLPALKRPQPEASESESGSGSGSDSDSDSSMETGTHRNYKATPRHADTHFLTQYTTLREKVVSEKARIVAAATTGSAATFEILNTDLTQLDSIYLLVLQDNNLLLQVLGADILCLKDIAYLGLLALKHVDVGGSATTVVDPADVVRHLKHKGALEPYQASAGEVLDGDNQEYVLYYSAPRRFEATDWRRLGLMYLRHLRRIVCSNILDGLLSTERKARAPRGPRNVDDTQGPSTATRAAAVDADELAQAQQHDTPQHVRTAHGVLRQRMAEDPDLAASGLVMFRFFINPHLFAQLVENLFYLSFLIKDGKVKVHRGADGVPMVSLVLRADQMGHQLPPHHLVFSLTYGDWQGLIRTFHITDSFLPHRTGPEYD